MATPRGMGSGKGRGLTGLAIMVMAKVWFIWRLVAASWAAVGGERGVGPGRGGVRLEVAGFGFTLALGVAVAGPGAGALLRGVLGGWGWLPLGGARGKLELPGRGLVELDRCGRGEDMLV